MANATRQPDTIRKRIRERYGRIAQTAKACCAPPPKFACCAQSPSTPDANTAWMGYSMEEIAAAPEAAELGLGCGNPQVIAHLRPGETVLDLGSGAGFDCLLAALAVGPAGRVIGVDMTEAMVRKARRNAKATGVDNIEFRKGEIERLPLQDQTVDVIISNCVVNLSPEKEAVLKEAFRVLKPGGRLALADVVALRLLPEAIRTDPDLQCACIGGAVPVETLKRMIQEAGFEAIRIDLQEESREMIKTWAPAQNADRLVVSAFIQAVKPVR
jgi:SAM-dependent methyltransferase